MEECYGGVSSCEDPREESEIRNLSGEGLILWSDKADIASPKYLEDERGRYSMPQPLRKHLKRLKQNEKMRQIYLNGEPLKNRQNYSCNAFALLKLDGRVCYIGRVGKGSLGVWEAHEQGSKYGSKKKFVIPEEFKEYIENM